MSSIQEEESSQLQVVRTGRIKKACKPAIDDRARQLERRAICSCGRKGSCAAEIIIDEKWRMHLI